MKRLELIKGLSYTARGFSCEKGKPFEVSDEEAAKMLKTGRFKELEDVIPVADGEPGALLSADAVNAMKKDELLALAEEKGIDISECKNNEERAEKICGMLGLASTIQLGLE